MAKIPLDGYRKQWPRIGGVLAMALGQLPGVMRPDS